METPYAYTRGIDRPRMRRARAGIPAGENNRARRRDIRAILAESRKAANIRSCRIRGWAVAGGRDSSQLKSEGRAGWGWGVGREILTRHRNVACAPSTGGGVRGDIRMGSPRSSKLRPILGPSPLKSASGRHCLHIDGFLPVLVASGVVLMWWLHVPRSVCASGGFLYR